MQIGDGKSFSKTILALNPLNGRFYSRDTGLDHCRDKTSGHPAGDGEGWGGDCDLIDEAADLILHGFAKSPAQP